MIDLSVPGVVAVAIRGENKGVVIYAEGNPAHSIIIEGDTVDNYVRMKVIDNRLDVFTTFAGEVDNDERAIENIYTACGYLVKDGVPKGTPIIIHAGKPFQRTVIETTI